MRDVDRKKEKLINTLYEPPYRKKIIDDLTQHIDELEVTFQSIGDGTIIVNTKGKISFFNAKAEELTGWNCKDAVGKPVEEVFRLVNENIQERCVHPVKSTIATGVRVGLTKDTALITRDGSMRYVSASCAPIRDKQENIKGAVLVFRDITRIKRTEEALKESEAKYRTIVENTFDLVFEVDSQGKILYVNPACKELAGYEQDELLGHNSFDFIHPDDLPNALSVFQRAVSNLTTEKITFRARDKNGEYHWLECIGKPFLTETGEIHGVNITRDVTERKKAEDDIVVLNTVMKAVHQFCDLKEVYTIALDMISTMENVDMAMIYLIDKEQNEAVLQAHRNIPDFYIERAGRIPSPKGITWKMINSGTMMNVENAQKDPNIGPAGRDLGHHSILGIPIFLEKVVIGVIWFLSYKERKFSEREVRLLSALGDQIALAIAKAKMIEEIKTTQEQLLQSEKLASLGQLISSIAHEINNPLTPIIGYSQTLLKHPGVDEKTMQGLEVINSSANRVVKIIEKLLSFSRKYKPLRIYEDINNLIEQSLEFREYQLQVGSIEIVKDLDPELPNTMVDPNQLQQVFTNIILNAEQAMSEDHGHGSLTVKTRSKNKNIVEISISDNGPGIPKEVIGKVFDPFFTTKEPGKGTGLGLAVAYGIIKEHGGDIYTISEEGKGTTFVIELPVLIREAVSRSDRKERTHKHASTIAGKRILIVEDEELVINLIQGVLEEDEIVVDIARNGKEALGIIDKHHYDLIVCDIKMPHMNGITLYHELKTKNPDLTQRIIFITGDPSSETIDFLNEVGNQFITKPFKVEGLKDRINDLFATTRFV